MKTLSFKSLMGFLAIALMVGFVSCSETEVESADATPRDEVKSSQIDDSNTNDMVTFPMDKFEDSFGWYIGFMDPGDVYSVKYDEVTGMCILEDIGMNPIPPMR